MSFIPQLKQKTIFENKKETSLHVLKWCKQVNKIDKDVPNIAFIILHYFGGSMVYKMQ